MPTDPDGAIAKLRRELETTQRQVRELRLTLIRVACLLATGLIAAGLVVPAWRGDGDTARVVNVAYKVTTDTALWDDAGGEETAFGVGMVVGFLGLLAVSVAVIWVLLTTAFRYDPLRGHRWCVRLGVLAVIGSAIACIFSLVAFGSDEQGTEGGWGPMVLLVGSIAYQVTVTSRAMRELRFRPWADDPASAGVAAAGSSAAS